MRDDETGGLQPQFWIRCAGFPLGWLAQMRCPVAASAARRYVEHDARLIGLAPALEAELQRAFPRGHGKLARALAARAPLPDGSLPSVNPWNEVVAARELASKELDEVLEGELTAARHALYTRHADPRAREAILLSSPEAREMFDHMLAAGVGERKSRTRYREIEALLFLQRLCAKNETTSFFGPLGWGAIDRDRSGVELVLPASIDAAIAERRVAFEYWAVQAIADAINADPELADDLPIELDPTCRVEGEVLHYPISKRRTLPAPVVALLHAATGRPGPELVVSLAGSCSAEDASSALASLLRSGVLRRGLFVPTMTHAAFEHLDAAVRGLRDSAPRARWIDKLDELARRRLAYAAAPLADRAAQRADLELCFEATTEASAHRASGKIYAGRTVVYEDCKLDVTLVLGANATERIETALRGVVELCRWIARDVAAGLERRCRALHAELGGGEVDFLAFAAKLPALHDDGEIVSATRLRLAAAWEPALATAGDVDELVLVPGQLAEVLARLPPAALAGELWGDAVHAPDILLAAAGPDALRAGDFHVVLGEIHKMVYYEAHPVGLPFCPATDDVVARLSRLLPANLPRVMDAPQHHHSRSYYLPAGTAVDVVVPGTSPRLKARSAPVSELVVRVDDGRLVLRHLASTATAPLLSAVQNLLYHWCDRIPPIPAPAVPHLARVRLGDTVLRRRTWWLDTGQLAELVAAASPAASLIAAMRLVEHGLPTRLFAKSPVEPKPVFIDLENPLAVELLVKLARKASWLRLTEMYPDADALWLQLGDELHTSELRMTWVLRPRVTP